MTVLYVDGAGDGLSSVLDGPDEQVILDWVGLVVECSQQVDDAGVRVDGELVRLRSRLATQLVRQRIVRV